MNITGVKFTGITPYLHYTDIDAALRWLTRVFGFVEKGRWIDDSGAITNAELTVGANEIWLDGDPNWWKERGRQPDAWIGVWVDDADAMYTRVKAEGLNPEPPEDKFYAVRVLQIADPEGYTWGFMQRAPYAARHPK